MNEILQNIEPDFYNIVEKPGYLKNVLYSDTDSIFIVIPSKSSLTKEQKWELIQKTGDKLNQLIQEFLFEKVFPRANIKQEYNRTNFKSELYMSAIMFLNVKKNYAYKIICKKGNFYKEPKVEYTGIQVKKTDTPVFTQNLLRELIENIILNEDVEDKKSAVVDAVQRFHDKFLESINNYDFAYIGKPGKWSKNKTIINGMKLYNMIMGKEIFKPTSAGVFVYCQFHNDELAKDFNGITVPRTYDSTVLKQKMQEYGIEPDVQRNWEMVFTKTCKDVVSLVK